MTIECPPCQWPTALEERGPAEDPTILLTGTALIGDAEVQIIAIRVDPLLRWTPDYRSDVAETSYQANGLDTVLETTLEAFESVATAFADVLGESRSTIVDLATGPYRIGVMPAAFGP
jgi:hypothetical protein